jgi:ureidoglycolate lyase
MRRILPDRLTGAEFAPFGEVVEHAGKERRRRLTNPFDALPEATRFAMWITRADAPARLPLRVSLIVRLRTAAQTFIPLTPVRYLVVVAPSDPAGLPDLAGIRAFIAGPGQGVSYRRETWHHGLTVLDRPGRFAVFMWRDGGKGDEEFVPVAPFTIRIP